MVMALSAIFLPPVFQKTTNAVTENNYSFRQSLLLEKQFISPPPTIAAVSTQGTPASEQLCPGLHRRSVLPLPVAETAWPCPLGHKAPKFNFDDTDEEISAISGVTAVWLCCVSRGHGASAPLRPLSITCWSKDHEKQFNSQGFPALLNPKSLPLVLHIQDQTQNSGQVLQTKKKENSLAHTTFL